MRYDEGFLALLSDVIDYEQDEEWIGKSIYITFGHFNFYNGLN